MASTNNVKSNKKTTSSKKNLSVEPLLPPLPKGVSEKKAKVIFDDMPTSVIEEEAAKKSTTAAKKTPSKKSATTTTKKTSSKKSTSTAAKKTPSKKSPTTTTKKVSTKKTVAAADIKKPIKKTKSENAIERSLDKKETTIDTPKAITNSNPNLEIEPLLPPPPKGVSGKKAQVIFDNSVLVKNKKTVSKTSSSTDAKKSSKDGISKKEAEKLAIEAKKNEKKLKSMTKEEKLLYKKLDESFNFVANLTWVIEEKKIDQKIIPDLTLGEIHVLEMVDRNNGKPMTKIANLLKVTVGSLTIGVNRLVAKEYLLRIRDDKDHRIINLSVTPKAKKILKAHDKFHEDILLGVLDGVTIRDATKVMAQFARVLENYINPKERTYASPSKTTTK